MGVVQLTTVTAINMMGSGIILLPATLAEIGTVSIFAWILASIGATILAYAFAKCGMYSKKVGGMGGYAEYRFGRLGNFLSNYTYAISLIIANVAIATGVVSYGSYVFGFDLSPMEVCLATISTLAIAASISLVGPKKFGKFTSLGMICILLPVIGLLLCGWHFFSPDIYVAAWNPHDMPFYLTMRDSIAVILWAFLGLETACANSDTVENPEKNVPVAVLAGTMIAGVCYMTSTAIIGGLVPHTELVSAGAPFGLAYAAMFGNTVGHMVSAMLVVSCFVSLTAWQFTISEVVREAATIGHFPSYLRKVNRFYAPYMAIGTLVCIQSQLTRDLPMEDIEIETPLEVMKGKRVAGKKVGIVPILRAGFGMLDGLLELVPSARVGVIGLYRDPVTAKPVEYYCKLPDVENRDFILIDPMLATGGSAVAAIDMMKAKGVKNIKFMCLVAAPEGVQLVNDAHPDVPIYTAALDRQLNEKKYILPGLGDAGDRIFGTK